MTSPRLRIRFVCLVLIAFALSSVFASATYAQHPVTFSVTGTFQPSFTGGPFAFAPGSTITIDTSTGMVTASNLTITVTGDQYTLAYLTNPGPTQLFWANSPSFGSLLIQPPTSFVGFTGGKMQLATYIPDLATAYTSTDTVFSGACQVTIPPPPDGSTGKWYQLDPTWKTNPYDTTTPPKNTIGDQGCALTALAACIAFVGYTNNQVPLPPGPYDPGTLNLALDRIPGAYSPPITPLLNSGGAINFPSAVTGASVGSLWFDMSQNGQASTQALDAYLCAPSPKPVIVQVPGSPALGGRHYVVVTGKDSSGNYSIIDPGHQYVNSLSTYGNQFTVKGAVKKANGDPSVLAFVVSDWATLLVSAPDGSKTGYDPVSGQELKGSDQSAYDVQDNSIDTDDESVAATSTVYSVSYSFPPDGTYSVELVGLQPGTYQLGINAFDVNGAQEDYITKLGIATAGSSSSFQVKYSSVPGSVTAVTRRATFASTLADIANSVTLGLIDNAGIGNALAEKINEASLAGESDDAREALHAFTRQVSAQTGKHITGIAPQILLEDAAFLVSRLPPTEGEKREDGL